MRAYLSQKGTFSRSSKTAIYPKFLAEPLRFDADGWSITTPLSPAKMTGHERYRCHEQDLGLSTINPEIGADRLGL